MKNIPKICHLYWDKSPMSYLQSLTVYSFHKYNPDWEIIIHIPNKKFEGHFPYVKYVGVNYFDKLLELDYVKTSIINLDDYDIDINLHDVFRSDIFRYYILNEYGGVWSDFDVLWLKPILHIKNIEYISNVSINNMEGTICLRNTLHGYHNISILIYSKDNEMLKSMINDTIDIRKNPENYPKLYWNGNYNTQAFGTEMLNHLYGGYISVVGKFKNIIGLKYETYFPVDPSRLDVLFNDVDNSKQESNLENIINNNVLGLHWFNGHPLSKIFVNNNNYEYNCVINNLLKKEGWDENI